MEASIIITGDTKEKYLIKTINSCLKQNFKKIQIILVFSYLSNLKKLKRLFDKKVNFKRVPKKSNLPVKDQLYKIKDGLKIAKGKNIFLLDGDDYFKKDKINTILSISKKNELYIDDFSLDINNKYFYIKEKYYKKNFLFKFFFNSWPDKICTSCISGHKDVFINFYNKINIEKINYLAIDILLVLYNLNNTKKIDKILTIKKIVPHNVDNIYSNLFSLIYWKRRVEQHLLFKKITKKNLSLEYYICKTIIIFFDFRKYIQKIF